MINLNIEFFVISQDKNGINGTTLLSKIRFKSYRYPFQEQRFFGLADR